MVPQVTKCSEKLVFGLKILFWNGRMVHVGKQKSGTQSLECNALHCYSQYYH